MKNIKKAVIMVRKKMNENTAMSHLLEIVLACAITALLLIAVMPSLASKVQSKADASIDKVDQIEIKSN